MASCNLPGKGLVMMVPAAGTILVGLLASLRLLGDRSRVTAAL